MDKVELMPVDLMMRFHFIVDEQGQIQTRAEAVRMIVRCTECRLNAKCPILKNHAFMDEEDFWCAYGEMEEEDDANVH